MAHHLEQDRVCDLTPSGQHAILDAYRRSHVKLHLINHRERVCETVIKADSLLEVTGDTHNT